MSKPLVALATLVVALASVVCAQSGLYGPEAPQDVAFVRVLNATPEGLVPTLGSDALAPVGPEAVGPYVAVEPGPLELTVEGVTVGFEGFPESFATVVVLPGFGGDGVELTVLAEAGLRDISRGLLSFWNLTDAGELSLATTTGAEVFAGVPPGRGSDRAIAEAEVGFVVIGADGGELGEVSPRVLERGVAHAIFVLPAGAEGDSPRIVFAAARAEP